MLFALINGDPASVTSRLPLLMLPAFVGCYVCAWLNIPGLLSCFQLAAFAVSAAMFTEYRSERGLWMLAALYFVIWAGISLLFMYGEALDWMRGVAVPISLAADAAMAVLVMHAHTKYLWKITMCNLAISRSQP